MYYILDGGGMHTTGGSMPDPRTGRPGSGRRHQRHQAGDVIVIPPGTAHWFSKINGHVTCIEARFPGNVTAPPAR